MRPENNDRLDLADHHVVSVGHRKPGNLASAVSHCRDVERGESDWGVHDGFDLAQGRAATAVIIDIERLE